MNTSMVLQHLQHQGWLEWHWINLDIMQVCFEQYILGINRSVLHQIHLTQDIGDSQYMNMAVEMDDRSQPPSKLYHNVASTIRLRLSAT